MDLHYKQEVAVGGLVIVGVVLFIMGTMWLGGASFRREEAYHARFTDVGKLKEGSTVKISGVEVGRVTKVEFMGYGDVLVSFTATPNVHLQADATAELEHSLAFSEASLILHPGTSLDPLQRSDVIPGRRPSGAFDRVGPLADRADSVLIGAQAIMSKRTADELHATLVAMQRTMNALADRVPATTEAAQDMFEALGNMMKSLDTLVSNPGLKKALAGSDSVVANMAAMTAQFTTTGARLDSLLTAINSGQGTLGMLATDSGLYHDTRALSAALKALLDTLSKHPGKITVQVKMF